VKLRGDREIWGKLHVSGTKDKKKRKRKRKKKKVAYPAGRRMTSI
jgi:hypothetical protein